MFTQLLRAAINYFLHSSYVDVSKIQMCFRLVHFSLKMSHSEICEHRNCPQV